MVQPVEKNSEGQMRFFVRMSMLPGELCSTREVALLAR